MEDRQSEPPSSGDTGARNLVTPAPYLLRLADRVASGLQGLSPERRAAHRRFLLAQQMPDGGFAGREPGSDLYYTGFAVRGLAVLDGLESQYAESIAGYLKRQFQRQLTVIDLLSWLYCAIVVQASGGEDILSPTADNWPDRLATMLEAFRSADGGYRKTQEGAAGSMYHSFLVVLCYELIGRKLPHPRRLVQFVFDRQRDDGGFVEIAPMKRSGTNPTAAGAAILTILGALDEPAREDIGAFLKEARGSEGGFLANSRIPFSDGLSTFTGLLTAQDLGFTKLWDRHQIETFINSLECPGGGFRGAHWDEVADVEYTFYGLGVLGLLGSSPPPA